MTTPSCNYIVDHLDSWWEGDRFPQAQSHLQGCPHCRGLVEDLTAIRSAARAWTANEEPPARVWNSLRAQLQQEGLLRETQPQSSWFRGWFAALPRPALAGAYLAALIGVAFAFSGPVNRRVNDYRWVTGTQDVTAPLSAQLDTVERNAVSSLAEPNPEVAASLHSNLAIVDNYIALCEKSVREDPEDEVARDYLYGAYQQKADLLAQISERGDYGR